MMLTILISTLVILALTISSTTVVVYKLSIRDCRSCRMLQSFLAEEKTMNRELLGLPGDRTPPTSPLRTSASLPPPENDSLSELESLSPDMQAVLLREYQEHLSQYPKNQTVHPDVPQITPGQTIAMQ
jgi:hypothetical protein